MFIRINVQFNGENLKTQFLTETILKTVLKPYGFVFQNFWKINNKSFSLIFENKGKFSEEELTKVLNCIPDSDHSLGICNYGWTFGIIPYIVKNASQYEDKIYWTYQNGFCKTILKYKE